MQTQSTADESASAFIIAARDVLMGLKLYFTAHEDYEADQIGVTADAASAKYTALSTACAAVNACRSDIGTKENGARTAGRTLQAR